MNRTLKTILAVFFIAVIMISAIYLSQGIGKNMRLDITDQQLYTLSDGTKNILGKLKQPLSVKLYYSKTASLKAPDNIKFFNNYYVFVKALLEEYAKAGKGNINLEVIDPRPYTQEELAAIRHGLKRFTITEEESFFFGLVVQTQFGVTKKIDFFSPDRQNFVEYDISYLIDTAITREKKKVGVLSSIAVMGDDVTDYMKAMMRMQGQQPKDSWAIMTHLKQTYDVSTVAPDADTIENVDVLLVIQPKDLSEQTLFAIDQYVLNGGRAIFFVDPHCVMDRPSQEQQMSGQMYESTSDVPQLLKAWGMEMPKNTFAGDRALAVTGTLQQGARPEKILGFQRFTKTAGCFNPDAPLSAPLNDVTFMFPGTIKLIGTEEQIKDSGLTYTPLLMTSAKGNTWTVSSPYELMRPNHTEMMMRFNDGSEPVEIGYMVTGMFNSAFPDGIEVTLEADTPAEGEPPAEPKTETKTGLKESATEGAIIVIADVDFMSDIVAYQRSMFGVMPQGDNSALLMNCIEDMAGSTDLMSIRSRGNFQRPFTLVDQIEAEAEKDTADEETKIVAQIKGFEAELNEKISTLERDKEKINSTIQQEKLKIEQNLREAEIRLRNVKQQKVEHIETLKAKLRGLCTLPGPAITLVIAIVLGLRRAFLRKYYRSHLPNRG